MNPKLTYNASIIFSWHRITKKFVIVKSRYTEPVSTSVGFLTEKYLGIQTTIDGQFASEAELMLFLLKYEGLTEEKAVSLPII